MCARNGFGAVALATALLPLAALALVARLRAAPLQKQAPSSLLGVVGIVWVPGLALAISGVGLAAFTALSVAFMAGRLLFGHLPDRTGGAKVALAVGAYTAFLDLSLGMSSPALGLVASRAGLPAAFGASALAVLCSAAIVLGLLRRPNPVQASETRGWPAHHSART